MEDKEILLEQYKKLDKNLRDFINAEKWRQDTSDIAKSFSLDEESQSKLENEIFFVLIGFEAVSDFKENIKKVLNINDSVAGSIEVSVNQIIFSKIMNDLKNLEVNEEEEKVLPTQPSKPRQSNVGNSFEENILNQAIAMMPAVPENLPTEESASIQNPNTEPKYTDKKDPYREEF